MNTFNEGNTEGYTPIELDELNDELEIILSEFNEGTDEYYAAISAFSDEVSHR